MKCCISQPSIWHWCRMLPSSETTQHPTGRNQTNAALLFNSPLPCYEITQHPAGRNQTNAALFSLTAAVLWSETAELSKSARSETTQHPTGRNPTNAALFSLTAAMLWTETAEQSERARSQKPTQLSIIHQGYCTDGWPLDNNKGSGDGSVVRGTQHQTRDWKVAGSSSQQENVLLQGQLCVLALISVSIPPRVPAVAHKRSSSFCQNCRWHIAAKHMSTLCTGLWTKWHCKLGHSCTVYTEQAPRWKKFQMASAT